MDNRGTPMVYFRSLNRPFLLFRVEKKFFFLSLLLSLPVAWSGMFMNLWADFLAVIIFVVMRTIGLLITRQDPFMLELYLRHKKYARFYRAQPRVNSPIPPLKDSVPLYEGKGGLV